MTADADTPKKGTTVVVTEKKKPAPAVMKGTK